MILLELTPIARFTPTPDWVLYTLMGCIAMICVGKLLFASKFKALTNRIEYLSLQDENVVFGFLVYLLTLVLSTLMVVHFFDVNLFQVSRPFAKFWLVFGLIAVIMLVKTAMEIAYNKAFYAEEEFNNFFGNSSYINARNVLALLIICFLFFYSPINKGYIIIASAIILIANRLWELYNRYFSTAGNFSENWYHNILYLCTLEILPIMVLIKLLLMGKVI